MTMPYGLLDIPKVPLRGPLASSEPQPMLLPQAVRMALPPPPPPKKKSKWQHIQEAVLPVSEGMTGLLSEQEIGKSRKTALIRGGLGLLASVLIPGMPIGMALAHGFGQAGGGFDDALKGALSTKEYSEKKQKEAALVKQRAAIAQRFPAQPNETAVQTLGRVQRMLPAFIEMNDTEMVGKMVELLKSQGDLLKPPVPVKQDFRVEDNVLGADGRPYKVWYDNDTGAEMRRVPQFVKPDNTSSNDRLERRLDAQNINQVLDDYRSETGKTIQLMTRVRTTASPQSLEKALRNDAAAQIAILYAFVNMMDETAVREGEQQMVRMAGPLYEQAKGYIQRNMQGKAFSVGPTLLKQMHGIIGDRVNAFTDQVNLSRQRARDRAKMLGMPNIDELIPPFTMSTKPDDDKPAFKTPDIRFYMKQ